MEGGPHGVAAEAAIERVFHFSRPPVERSAARTGIVAKIVTLAHKRIDRAHCGALRGAEQEERIIEVFGAAARDSAAIPVRLLDFHPHAARRNAARTRD